MLQRTLWVLALTLAGCTSALPAGGGAPTAAAAAGTSPAEQGWLAPETVVDEYKVAGPIECPLDPTRPHDYLVTDAVIKEVNARCDEVVQIATAAVLKRHSLDSTTIGTSRVYSPYLDPGHEFSAPAYIVVFDLADGSQVAGGVFCAIGPCRFMNPRKLDAPEPVDHTGPEVESSPSS
jgi:hypothetical protein